MEPGKVILWDIDGTILLTPGSGYRAMTSAGQRMFGQDFSLDGIDFHGQLDRALFQAACRNAGITDHVAHEPAYIEAYLADLTADLADHRTHIEVMPGVQSLIQTLATRSDVLQGVVTGNYRRAAEAKLRAIGFDPATFAVGAFGEEASHRDDLIALALHRLADHTRRPLDPRAVIVIGDTPRDIACARANGCVSFAVATGHHTTAELRDLGADHVVQSLQDPTPLLNLL